MLERVQYGVQHVFSHVIKLIIITILFLTEESIDFNTYIIDRSYIFIDSNVLFKDDSFEVLSHRCSINNKEVSTFSRVIAKYNVLRVLRTR